MALSPEARARLEAIAEQGGFPPVLSLGVSDHTPEAGSRVTVSWNFRDLAGGGQLRVGDRAWAVQAVGERVIDVAALEFTITLLAGGQVAAAVIRPRVLSPIIRALGTEGPLVAGAPVRISWLTQLAETCELRVQIGDLDLLNERVQEVGDRLVTPRRPGLMSIRLVARSRHARFGEVGSRSQEVNVPIAAPPVKVEASPAHIGGPIGEEVVFSWRLEGAERIQLLAPERDQRFRLEAMGQAFVKVGLLQEVFLLRAEGLDGRLVTKTFCVTPAAPDVSLPIDLMKELDRPWNDKLI